MNCPFYGFAMFVRTSTDGTVPPFVLIGTSGNQCGLVNHTHAPCWMEMNGDQPEWTACPLVADIRLGKK